MHHFFVTPECVHDNYIGITGSDVNHIRNVLRMKNGEELLVSDGEGRDYLCIIDNISDEEVTACIIDGEYEGTELPTRFYLFQGLPKGDKMEMIIQKAVELGCHEIIPVKTQRTIVKLDKKKEDAKLKRWNAISESAAKQSRRSIIPQVNNVMTFKEAVKFAESFDINIIPYENYKDMTETSQVIDKIKPGQKVGIFIGPEGGFADDEVDFAVENDIQRISLGKRILRTETAGMAILSVLMFQIEERSC